MIIRSVLGWLAFALVLFLPAGTLDWPQAWLFLALFIACGIGIGLWLLKTDPALLAARMESPMRGDQRPRDRAIIWLVMIAFWAWLIFMAFDAKRFGWSHMPLWAQALGAMLIILSFWGDIGVLRANSFAAVNIRVQTERQQSVASTGPYAVVRHPMYAWVVPLLIGMPLLLGSLWGLLWLPLFILLLAARAVGEEEVLHDGLPGYRDYAAKVRYRLMPGIW